MSIFGITTQKYREQIASLGITMLDFNNSDNIPNVSQVFIYDYDGIFEQAYLKKLVTSGCTIAYAFYENGESNVKYLSEMGVYNSYAEVEPKSINAEYITNTLKTKKSLADIQDLLNKQLTVSSLNMVLNELDLFLDAINKKEKDTIEEVFNRSFDSLLNVKSLVNDKIVECEANRKLSIRTKEEVADLQEQIANLKSKMSSLVKSGRVCEQDNKKLSEALTKLDAELSEKDEALIKAEEKISQYVVTVSEYESKLQEANQRIVDTTNTSNLLRSQNESLLKQVNKYSTSMTRNFSIENIKVNLTNTGLVSKILYIKVIDAVPYLISSLKLYPTYIANAKKKEKGCAFVLITPTDSTIFDQYSKDNPILSDTAEISDCKNKMYVMNGFNTIIEKFIVNCGCELCIILDFSFKNTKLTSSFRQHDIYVVNSQDTIERNILNPKECISFTPLADSGVIAQIPQLTGEELTTYKGSVKLKNGLFTILDTFWG